MATFEYQALTGGGRLMTGTLEAASHEQAGEALREMKLTVNSLTPAKPKRVKTTVGRNEFILFNQQLASLTKAGIPLEKGLRELAGDIAGRSMRKLINEIAADLEAGVGIEKAFEKKQKHFPPLYGRILKAGVETGRLSEMLISLNRHMEMTGQTRRIIFESMCYPLVILAIAAVVMTGIFLTVVPPLADFLGDMHVGTPVLTKVFIAMAENTVPFWLSIAVIVVVLLLLRSVLSRFEEGRRFKETVFLKIPLLGRVYRSSILSRLADATALLINSGCDIPQALRLSAATAGSDKLKRECQMLCDRLEEGAGIMEAGQFFSVLPRLFLYSMQLGAQRNELQDNLYHLSDMYAQQARCAQARLSVALLPAMLIVVGGVLLTAVLAMFLPMMSMVTCLS